jgi:hypothetical protein
MSLAERELSEFDSAMRADIKRVTPAAKPKRGAVSGMP